MQTLSRRLGNVGINRRVGLAIMTFAAILPVGLSAVGNEDKAALAAFVGLPVVLLGSLAWRGDKSPTGTALQKQRVRRQMQMVVAVYITLLCSVFQWQWPRDAAIFGSVALNRAAFEQLAEKWGRKASISRTGDVFLSPYSVAGAPSVQTDTVWNRDSERPVRLGLVTVVCAGINKNGEVRLYDEQNYACCFSHHCVYKHPLVR